MDHRRHHDSVREACSRRRHRVEQARVVFPFIHTTGLRRDGLLGLRRRNVDLADPAGPSLRACETVVRGRADTPKSAASERTIALGPKLSEESFEYRAPHRPMRVTMNSSSLTRTRDQCSTMGRPSVRRPGPSVHEYRVRVLIPTG
jgi:hypothetical protein